MGTETQSSPKKKVIPIRLAILVAIPLVPAICLLVFLTLFRSSISSSDMSLLTQCLSIILVGTLGLGAVFGIAALADAPARKKWHQLASRLGLEAQTFGTTRLSGYSQSHYVTIERYSTPDPRNPRDAESGILWTRIVMTVKNVQQSTFIVGRSSVLNNIGGWFDKPFKNATSLTLVDNTSPQSFFVKHSPTGLVQSLLIRSGEIEHALLSTDRVYFIQLDGPRLSYTELGIKLMDNAEIERSAQQLSFALSLLNKIAEHIETYRPMSLGTQ